MLLTSRSTMLGLLFLSVLTAWKTSTERWCWSISHTMLMAQNVPLRPPPFLQEWRETHRNSEKVQRPELTVMQWWCLASRWRCFIFNGRSSCCTQTYRQWTTVRPSPPSYSSCHLSTCRMSFRKERLDMGVSLYMGQPRNWNCCTIRYPSWGWRGRGWEGRVEDTHWLFLVNTHTHTHTWFGVNRCCAEMRWDCKESGWSQASLRLDMKEMKEKIWLADRWAQSLLETDS